MANKGTFQRALKKPYQLSPWFDFVVVLVGIAAVLDYFLH
jgi:hypothetical protein